MKYHQEGHSVAEIALLYNLSPVTVYRSLQAIADANGVTRDSLLVRIVKPTANRRRGEHEEKSHVEIQNLKEGFSELSDTIDGIIKKINLIKEEDANGN